MTKISGLWALAGLVALSVSSATAATPAASNPRNGELHIQKDCTVYTGLPGSYCTIVSSNLAQIPKGSNIYYDQADGIPTGMLDSNIVLDAGNGNRAVGRCTLDDSTGTGLCTFSDGTGLLAGFTARVDVSYLSTSATQTNPNLFGWEGTFSFNSVPPAGSNANGPSVVIAGGPTQTTASRQLVLDASGSTSPVGLQLMYVWTQVRMNQAIAIANATSATPLVTFASGKDQYLFQVVVTDSKGNSATQQVSITYTGL
jgi:hypothetical protein